MEGLQRINNLLNSIPITSKNKKEIEGAKRAIANGDYTTALSIIQNLNKKTNKTGKELKKKPEKE